jgi:chromosome segregation ATPase
LPRPGVKEQQFLAAIAALQGRGEKVTQMAVLKELGTGSATTVGAFLATWREQQAEASSNQTVPVPESVKTIADAASARIWTAAIQAAEGELAPQREALARDKDAMEATLAESAEVIRHLEHQLESVAAQLTEATAQAQASQLRLAEQAEQVGYLRGKLEATESAAIQTRQKLTEAESLVRALEARLKSAAEKGSPAYK